MNTPNSLTGLLPDTVVDIVDIGANPLYDDPPYKALLKEDRARVIGFEPNKIALYELQRAKGPNETYLPYAVGDGNQQTLNLCACSGMSSLLKPNRDLLQNFYGYLELSKIVQRVPVDTKRLDDIEEIKSIDFLKIDIQGYELEVFRNGTRRLKETLVIQTEVEFLPMYENQPLFSDIDIFLRQQGFLLHKFEPIVTRTFQPIVVDNDSYKGLNQALWTDAIYVRDFRTFDTLSPEKLAKAAIILHDIYHSWDLAFRALLARGAQLNTDDHMKYIDLLNAAG